MARIFICYRREDSAGYAGRLHDALAREFGEHEIFRDIETIAPGEDFVQAMTRAVRSSRVVLALIGKHWSATPSGSRRIDDPDDHVRRELAEALAHTVRVIPVLVERAEMPASEDLPDELKPLATRNAITLDDDDWDHELERLTVAIRNELGGIQAPMRIGVSGPSRIGAKFAAAGFVVLLALVWWNSREPVDVPAVDPAAAASASASRTRAATSGSDTAVAAAATTGQAVTLPLGADAELVSSLYEVLDARLVPTSSGASVILRIRLTNNGRYDAALNGADFRLIVDDGSLAPASGPLELVPSRTAKGAELAFETPRSATAAVLRITQGDEAADIPLDLDGRQGATASQHAQTRRAGGTTFTLRLDPSRALLRLDWLHITIRSVLVRRYANKLILMLTVRAENHGRYPANFWNSQFRLLVDGVPRAPAGELNKVVDSGAAEDGAVEFDLPLGTRAVVLRVQNGDALTELPLNLPAMTTSEAAGRRVP